MKKEILKIPKIVGILNLSPESFSSESVVSKETIIEHARQMIVDGADILDVGAQSTRPGAPELTVSEEVNRIQGVIKELRSVFSNISLSIDTTKSEVAEIALQEGANTVNDISGGRFDPRILPVVKKYNAYIVITHSDGVFGTMHAKYHHTDIVSDIKKYFIERIQVCLDLGILKEKIILDSGIGFSKVGDDNLEIIRRLNELNELGYPLYVGLSRKRFIGTLINESVPEMRDNATTALHVICIQKGVDYIRTHNVKDLKECIQTISGLGQ